VNSIDSNLLKRIIADQKEEHTLPADYYQRSSEEKLNTLARSKEITVVTGIRRCGKSVLLNHLRDNAKEKDYYFNFEDERLALFTSADFQTLQEVFIELYGVQKIFYFDEIQNIPGWEMFIRRLYNAGNKIFITGSNANLFSEELGTRLTGRYMTLSVYPFSFYEWVLEKDPELLKQEPLSTTQTGIMRKLFNQYGESGGIPEYAKHKQADYLHSLYESILYRDIVTRYRIANPEALKKLVYYLASNCAKQMTYNSLRKLLGLGSTTTISDYCAYLENSFLCFFVNRYSESLKSQQQSPKKVYFIDHVLAKIVGFRFGEDLGRRLENIVYVELKRRGFDIYYHNETKECDFVVRKGEKTISLIQVCHRLADERIKAREVDGLLEALEAFSFKEGYIITDHEEAVEEVTRNKKRYKINIIPIWKWLLN